MPLGFQMWPGAPSDPSQPEQPSFLELLGTLAANIYGGDPRYSAAAGLGAGAADIFGGMRKTRQETQQAQILKGLYPDLPLDKFKAAGMKLDLGDLASMQSANEKKSALAELTKALETPQQQPTQVPGAAGGVSPVTAPQMSLGQWLKAQEAGIRLPESVLKAQSGNEPKSPWQAEMVAAGGDVNKALAADTTRQQQIAGLKTGQEASAKRKEGGSAEYLKGGASPAQMMVAFGVDPRDVQPGDPIIAEAQDAVGISKARQKVTAQERNVYKAIKEANFGIGRLKSYMDQMKKSGLATDQQTIVSEWLKYDAMQSGEVTGKLASAYILGPPKQPYQRLFSLAAQVKSRLILPYMPPGMRSQGLLMQLKQHMPQEGAPLPAVLESVESIEPLLKNAEREYAPEQDPTRKQAIRKLTGQVDPSTGRKINEAYATYLIDKRMGLTPSEDPNTREPAVPSMPESP